MMREYTEKEEFKLKKTITDTRKKEVDGVVNLLVKMTKETKQKYIRHSRTGFTLWSGGGNGVSHYKMADFINHADKLTNLNKSTDPGEIVSAGFVIFDNGLPFCFGFSESLRLKSLPEDSDLLSLQLGLKGDLK